MKNFFSVYRALGFAVLTALVLTTLPVQKPTAAEKAFQERFDEKQILASLGNVPVYFEENQGQFDKRARYLARGTAGYTLFLTPTDAVYVLQEEAVTTEDRRERAERMDELRNEERKLRRATAVYMSLVGGNEFAASEGVSQLEHRTNYFKGRQENWRTEIPNYAQVRFDEVYAGVDLIWHGRSAGAVQYDFEVAPNAVPEQIEWEIKGAKEVELTAEGDLVIKTEYGEIRHGKPFSYQEADGLRAEVESGFVLRSADAATNDAVRVGFYLGDYDRTKPLVIDPTVNLMTSLSYSTFLGEVDFERGYRIATDSAGNAYVTGTTDSIYFPTTTGAYDEFPNGNFDVFVTKLNAAGSGLIYSTFLGGSFDDFGLSIAIDSAGNAYVTGEADSTNFPTTTGAYDTSHNGVVDVFISKLNAGGNGLIYSTFLGSTASEVAHGIAIDSAGNAYVTGWTNSSNFPTTTGAFDDSYNGNFDVFVSKLNGAGSFLIYSTFLGGSNSEEGRDIAVNTGGNAFVVGLTESNLFPTTGGAFDITHNGGADVFVTRVNASGGGLDYSTFIGGTLDDIGNGIALDSAGNAFVTGLTFANNFPTTLGAFDTSHDGNADVFVTKVNATGAGLTYSTFLGASDADFGHDVVIDDTGNAYVTGSTESTGFPTTTGAYDTSHNGTEDVFVSKLNAVGSSLLYSTFLGGDIDDFGYGIAIDSSGNVYLTGSSSSTNFPTTSGAFDTSHNGSDDAFVTKLDLTPTAAEVSIGGRVFDENGYAVRGAIVTLTQANGTTLTYRTNSFGYYRFDEIPVGQTVIVAVRAKGSHYNPQLIPVSEELTNLDFFPTP